MNHTCALSTVAVAIAGSASAVTIDGSLDVDYGSALSVQQVPTGFGDNSIAAVDDADGSELDNAYAAIADGNLYLFFGGNLAGFNKLAIFIDNGSGLGQNVVTGATGLPGTYTGFTFDSGFNATNFISVTSGNNPAEIYVDYSDIVGDTGGYAGTTSSASDGTLTGGSNGVGGALFATINNANTAGVTGSDAAGAGAVTTGMEIAISLAALGNPSSDISVSAFINGANHDFLSNQVLGSLPTGTGNLGGDGAGTFTGNVSGIDFNDYAGNQYFTVAVPEPASVVLIGLGGLLMLRRRA